MKMTFEQLQEMSIVDLKEFLEDSKIELYDLFMKLDISILRFGVMSLVSNSCYSRQYIIETDDILYKLSNLMTDLNSCNFEFSRRKQNA